MDILKALEGIDLNEEQEKSIVDFMTSFAEDVRAKIQTAHTSEIDSIQAENKKAFELFEEKTRKAFNLFYEDSKNAFDKAKEELIVEHTENMAKALEDLFEDVEVRAKQDILESAEFKALNEIKKVVAPMIAEGDKKSLLEEIETLKAEKTKMVQEQEELERKKVIETLLEDFPAVHAKTVRVFVEKAETVDEVYDRFNAIVEMLQNELDDSVEEINSANQKRKYVKKTPGETTDNTVVTPAKRAMADNQSSVAEVAKTVKTEKSAIVEDEDNKPASPVFESSSVAKTIANKTKKQKAMELFSEEEKQMLGSFFGLQG